MTYAPRHRNVLVLDGLRIHWCHKVAHSAIHAAVKRCQVTRAYPEEPSRHPRFMVVRHPLDRLVSAWSHFLAEPGASNELTLAGYPPGCSFDAFLGQVLQRHDDEPHTRMQWQAAGPWPIEDLVRLEALPEAWERLRHRHSHLPLDPLPQRNASRHGPWADYYSPTTRQAAEHVFAADLYLWEFAQEA